MKVVPIPVQFQWDAGNAGKNYEKHRVTNQEAEEIFFDTKKKLYTDGIHSGKEKRYILLGKTKNNRLLFVVFTIRGKLARVISARDLNRKEHQLYEEKT